MIQDLVKQDIWHAKAGMVKFVVHKYHGCGDAYYVTCDDLRMSAHDLDTDNLDVARSRAIDYVFKAVEAAISGLSGGMFLFDLLRGK